MSGRSAIVRKKNDSKGNHGKQSSVSNVRILPASSGRRDTTSDQGGSQGYAEEYGTYPTQQPFYGTPGYRQPREIVVESAIEKSAVRSQVDDLSDNFRGKLGRMLGGAKGSKSKSSKHANDGGNDPSLGGSTPTMHAVPSLSYTTSTEPQSQSLPPNFPFPNTRSKQSAARQAAIQYQQESAGSIHSQGRPEISIFAGHRERRSVTPWRNLSHPPESLASHVDTLVKLFVPDQETQPLASFHISSDVLRKTGCKKWADMLTDRVAPLGGDADTISSGASIPDYNVEGSSHPEGSRYNRAPKVKFELFLDCPDEALDLDPMNWAITTRNLFALIHDHDYLCGRTLFEALSQLSTRLTENPDGLPSALVKPYFLLDHLSRHRYLDARNSSAYALSMLAFSQLAGVKWKEGSVESFVHCVGLRLYGTFNTSEAQHISPYINVLITNMANELRKRLKRAQKYFAALDFGDMWPANTPSRSGGRAAFERFRIWLMQYLLRNDPGIREAIGTEELWMTHERIERYKKIFHSLFDYLVNRDIEFDDATDGIQPSIVSKSGVYFKADPNAELPMTGILTNFDTSRKFPHLPAPYPLVPPSQPPSKARHGNSKKAVTSSDDEEELEARSASYAEASNFELVAHDMNMDPIIAEFISFEQTDEIASVDPRDARLGRWVLIYGALQVLATIETVTPGVRFRDGARYCMSCKVAGVLPWVKEREGEAGEVRSPTHEMAYPFVAPRKWPTALPKPRTGSYRTIMSPEYGDGRKRPDLSQSPPARHAETKDSRPSSSGRPGILQTFSATSDKRQTTSSSRSGRGGLVEAPTSPTTSTVEDKAARERFEADKARGRREKAFGFTNYKPEAGW